MQCTRCSEHILPIVAVDIDGTLAEYHEPLTRFCSLYFNISVPTEPWDGQGEMEDYLGITKAQWRDMKFAYRSGGFKRFAPIYPGAKDFMDKLADHPLEVWITTTRPWLRLDSIDPDTRWWLTQNGIRFNHLLYDEHKYPRLAELVDPGRVIMVVDDLPEMVEEARRTFGDDTGFLMDRPHNGRITQDFGDFATAHEYIINRMSEWNLRHG